MRRASHVAGRFVRIVAGALLAVGGAALALGSFRYAGSVPVGVAMTVGGVVLLVAGLLLAGLAIQDALRGTAEPSLDQDLEERARDRGLPDKPEAYRDGGVGVAATTMMPLEAELIAQELSANDIPAWVDQSHASVMLSHLQFGINPGGVRVLVPLGRLDEARRFLEEHEPPEAGNPGT